MKKKINNVQKDEERKREKNARRRKSLLFGWWCEKEWIDENENVGPSFDYDTRDLLYKNNIYITL